MNKSEWLAGASLVVGLISLTRSLTTGNITLLCISIVLLVAFVVLLTYIIWRLHLSPWTVIGRTFKVEIMDKEGEKAVWKKIHEIRANHRGNKHYEHRNISCNGSIEKFESDPETRIVDQTIEAGDYKVTVEFDHQIPRGGKIKTWLDIYLDKSYPQKNEFIIALVDKKTQYLEMEIRFPDDRKPKPDTVKMHYMTSGTEIELSPPQMVNDNVVTWSKHRKWRKLPSGEYRLNWHW